MIAAQYRDNNSIKRSECYMNATHSELMGLDTIVDWHIGFSSSTKNLAGFIFGDIVGGIPTRLETGNSK